MLAHVSDATGMGVLVIDNDHAVVQANLAAEQLAAPWGGTGVFWQALSVSQGHSVSECRVCGRSQRTGSCTVPLVLPGGGRQYIQLTWTGHAHGLMRDRELSVAVVADVSKRECAEELAREAHARLVASEAELRAALDALPGVIVVMGAGGVLFTNRVATECFGDAPEWHAAIRAAAPARRGEPKTVILSTTNGNASYDVFAPEPIRFAGEAAELVMARDATQRVRVEAQLRTAERLVALGGLAAGLAHEINNPLTYVIGNLELAQEGVGDIPERIARALGGALRVRQVVAQLGDLAKPTPTPTESEALSPASAFESAVVLAAGAGLPPAQVHREFAAGAEAQGNAVWLGQIALNLVSNALLAMAALPPDARHLRLRSETVGERVFFEVSDSGLGVPEGLRERIFEPFVSTRAHGEGSGLGLYICRELALRMGGELVLAATETTGTTFRLWLPRAATCR